MIFDRLLAAGSLSAASAPGGLRPLNTHQALQQVASTATNAAQQTQELITSHACPHHPFMRVQASFDTPSKRLHAKPQPHHALKHAHQLQRQMHAVIMRDRGAWYHSAVIWVHFPSSAGIVPLNWLLYKLLPKPHSTVSTWPPAR